MGVPEKEEFYADCEYSDIGSKNVPNKSYQENIEKNAKFEKLNAKFA
jgi:hypothetical protein